MSVYQPVLSRRSVLALTTATAALVATGAVFAPLPAQATPRSVEEMMEERVIGSEDAPVEIIEYASLTCPHCAAFHNETYPELKSRYIDTGKVRMIMRDFPLDQPGAVAAMMARCAEPSRYFQFLDVLFKQQSSWSRSPDWVGELMKIGKLGGLSEEDFQACTSSQELLDGILERRIEAVEEYKVQSTPTFFINGKKLSGNQPLDVFVDEIEAILS